MIDIARLFFLKIFGSSSVQEAETLTSEHHKWA